MADVNVTVGLDASELATQIQQTRSQLAEIDPYRNVRAGTAIGSPPPFGLGGPPPVPGPLTQAAMAQVAANRELAQTQNEVAEASERAGINIGGMFERMATRMGILL